MSNNDWFSKPPKGQSGSWNLTLPRFHVPKCSEERALISDMYPIQFGEDTYLSSELISVGTSGRQKDEDVLGSEIVSFGITKRNIQIRRTFDSTITVVSTLTQIGIEKHITLNPVTVTEEDIGVDVVLELQGIVSVGITKNVVLERLKLVDSSDKVINSALIRIGITKG